MSVKVKEIDTIGFFSEEESAEIQEQLDSVEKESSDISLDEELVRIFTPKEPKAHTLGEVVGDENKENSETYHKYKDQVDKLQDGLKSMKGISKLFHIPELSNGKTSEAMVEQHIQSNTSKYDPDLDLIGIARDKVIWEKEPCQFCKASGRLKIFGVTICKCPKCGGSGKVKFNYNKFYTDAWQNEGNWRDKAIVNKIEKLDEKGKGFALQSSFNRPNSIDIKKEAVNG